ncbi:uncharacterized protein LOC121080436 [Falco naumanni]|uniref:uncharacterized protein LOC121080436 n=1 Tax=Falco naumanni TaxID=148594 RepID=UPI001ADE3D64|nr:uncharacterized protein LOC121080436 [Falco naumanni]
MGGLARQLREYEHNLASFICACILTVDRLTQKLSKQAKKDRSSTCTPTKASAIKIQPFSVQGKGYWWHTPCATLWFSLHDQEEDMRKLDDEPIWRLEAQSCAIEEHQNNEQVDQAARIDVAEVNLDWEHKVWRARQEDLHSAAGPTAERTLLGAPRAFYSEESPLPADHRGSGQQPLEAADLTLARDLESWEAPSEKGKLLQYVDDILIATNTEEDCMAWTVSLLNFLGLQGYRVSRKKAQVMQRKVNYLGYEISAGQRTLGQARKEVICQTKKTQTVKELRTFLGMTGWCRLWIYNYGLLVKPLYALTATEQKHLEWNKEAEQAFEQLKKALMSAPALGLPDVASFLSGNTGEPVHHDCLETIEATYASRPDLKDSPIENGENWFTDGSSYVLNGNRHAGYAITTSQEVIESGPLPMNTSAQKAEIIALT